MQLTADLFSTSSLGRPYQGLAVRKHDSDNTTDRIAILHRLHGDGDFIPGLEGVLAPASLDHIGSVVGLCDPMGDITLVVFDVELQPAMGIGPNPVRDGSLYGDSLSYIKSSIAVMRKQRNRADQRTSERKNH